MAPAPTLYGKGQHPREPGSRLIRPLHGGHLGLDYLNTVSDHMSLTGDDDFSPGYVNVVEWCWQAGVLTDEDTARLLRAASKEPREAAAVRKRVIAFREALYAIVHTFTLDGEPATDSLDLFNNELRNANQYGYFAANGPHLAWQWRDEPRLDRILWPIGQSAVELLTSERLHKVKQCQAEHCQTYFLDNSKNGSRRFCSAAGCGTADRVRRFRERRKSNA